mgnify:CR=1 FL=1
MAGSIILMDILFTSSNVFRLLLLAILNIYPNNKLHNSSKTVVDVLLFNVIVNNSLENFNSS